jgi:RNA polymerase sigma-70 factor (ECF subfamily)
MPPNPAWLRGRDVVRRYLERVVFGPATSRRLVATRANGAPAFGVYARPIGATGPHVPHAIHVVTLSRGRVADLVSFHDPSMFAAFGLPARM